MKKSALQIKLEKLIEKRDSLNQKLPKVPPEKQGIITNKLIELNQEIDRLKTLITKARASEPTPNATAELSGELEYPLVPVPKSESAPSLRKYHKLIIGLVLLSIVGYYVARIFTVAQNDQKLREQEYSLFADTKLYRVQKKDLKSVISFPGTVSFKEKASILTLATARVARIYKDVGDVVSKGTVLAELDKKRLRLDVAQARNNLQSARANYNLVNTKYKEARKAIKKRIIDLEKEKASLQALKAELLNMRKNYKVKKELLAFGAITQSDFDNFETQYTSLKAKYYNALKEQEKNSVGYTSKELEAAGYKNFKNRAAWERAAIDWNTRIEKDELRVAKVSLANARSQLSLSQLLLKEATIRSPISGVVAERSIQVGEMVKPDSSLFTVVSLKQVYVIGSVSEEQLFRVKKGQLAEFTIDAYPDKKFQGKVYLISPVLDPQTRTAEIRIIFNNVNMLLKPGMFVRTKIITGEEKNILAIPVQAFVPIDASKNTKEGFCFVVREGVAYKQKVLVKGKYDSYYSIASGLAVNDIIAASNVDSLTDGTRILSLKAYQKKKKELLATGVSNNSEEENDEK